MSTLDSVFLENSKPGILVVTVNQSNFCHIHYANFYLLSGLEFSKKNLIGHHLNTLIP